MSLSDTAWPDVAIRGTVLVPVGSIEQHGPHLPLDTDTVIATAVARELAPLIGASVAPAVSYGASGEHQTFPGTISIGIEVLTLLLIELGRSLTVWAGRVVFVNGHGGNIDAVRTATDLLREEGRDVVWVPCAVPCADAHAGRTETSLMLHLNSRSVRVPRAEVGNTKPLALLLPALRREGVAAASPNGILGDPTGANADEGAQLLQAMVTGAYDRVRLAVSPR